MRLVLGLLIVVVVAAGAIWSGVYDVAASTPHPAPVRWLFATVRDRSIAARAATPKTPRTAGPEQIARGYEEYDEMCVVCHGAPGAKPSAIQQGLNPPAPALDDPDLQRAYDDAQIFWVVKHGIGMTGMPAFGETHDDDTLWAIVAFVRRLPALGAKGYAAMAHEEPGEHEHSH